jgi:hypothetical protein
MAGVAFPSDVITGMDLGHQVGQAVVAYANADGSSQPFTGSFAPFPGCLEQSDTGSSACRDVASVGTCRRQPVPPCCPARLRLRADQIGNPAS